MLFLYNSGARADEAAHLTIGDFDAGSSSVSLHGKGRKQRQCPLWPDTVHELLIIAGQRPPQERVFLNRCGQPLTRFGIHAVVERYAQKAKVDMPSLAAKRFSPHSIRHSTATHLLRAGVDINTVRAFLGHASLNTTNIYTEIDLETKAQALAKCAQNVVHHILCGKTARTVRREGWASDHPYPYRNFVTVPRRSLRATQ